MSVLTEGKHNGQFLLSEGPGTISRESGILSSGQTVEDGRVLKRSGSELVVAAGTYDSSGDSNEDIVGVLIWPGKSPTTVAADTPVAYVARLAEVKSVDVKQHAVTGSTADESTDAVTAALAALNIILR